MGKKIENAIAILNGAVGDYLETTGNGLATPMELIHSGIPLANQRAAIAMAYPAASSRVVVLVHGLMCSESVWDFPQAEGQDYGARLARDRGYSPVYLRYNSGLAIPENGEKLNRLLAELITQWPTPIEELLLLGFSMGGLVIRSAFHFASKTRQRWLPMVRRAIYVGTPHRGAPLERFGRMMAHLLHNIEDPYTQLVAQISNLRSDGIKDLGLADLRPEDRERRATRLSLCEPVHPVPLLPNIEHFLVAGSISTDPRLATLFGDSIVPVSSATDGATTAKADKGLLPDNIRFLPGVAHTTLAHHAEVYEHISTWTAAGGKP